MQSHCKVAKITLDLSEFKVTNTALRFLSVYEYLPKSFLLFFKQLRWAKKYDNGGVQNTNNFVH